MKKCDSADELIDELFKTIQVSNLQFKVYGYCEEIENWLEETSHKYIVEGHAGEHYLSFKDEQGAVEFKLRCT